MDSVFTLEQIFYWLALATWFGGVMFVTLAAPVIFQTIRESDPTLPTVLSVNLEGQHSTLLAGSVVANLLSRLLRFQLVCCVVVGLSLVVQWVLLTHNRPQVGAMIVRTVAFGMATILLVYDWRMVSPRIVKYRKEYIDHADEPETANPAREQFDRYHRESVTILMFELFALLALVLFSANISISRAITMGQ